MDKNYDISFLDENKINEILENSKAKSKDKEEIRNIIEKAKKAELRYVRRMANCTLYIVHCT